MRLIAFADHAGPSAVIALSLLSLVACGGGRGGGSVAPDTAAPLATVTPSQTLIGDSAVITITFNESMNPASLTVTGNLAAASDGGIWSMTAVPNDTLTISPAGGSWPLNTNRTLTVNALDLAGNPLAAINLSYNIYRGTLYYVDGSRPDDTGNGLSPATARKYIHTAVASAAAPATIFVNAGTYVQSSAFGTQVMLKDDVSLVGGFNTSFTVHDPSTHVSQIEDRSDMAADFVTPNRAIEANNSGSPATNKTIIDGFTIQGSSQAGNEYSAAVVLRAGATPILRNNRINGGSGGQTSFGIYLFQASPGIVRNNIHGGSGLTSSYGLYNALTQATIEGNTIHGGEGLTDSYGMFTTGTASPSPTIQNNIIHGGGAQRSRGLVEYQAASKIRNNTIFSGIGPIWSRGIWIDGDSQGSAPSIENNIVFGNPGAMESQCVYESVSTGSAAPASFRNNNLFNCAVLYFDVSGGCPGNADGDGNNQTCAIAEINILADVTGKGGNIAVDPMLVNLNGPDGLINTMADNDWHLSAGSPLAMRTGGLNGRDQVSAWTFVTDLDNVVRPASATPWSMGAFEP